MIRPVLQLGDPRLYEISPPVTQEDLPSLPGWVEDLHDTLMEYRRVHGAGRAIAAPQIGVQRRLLYMYLDGPTVFVNPSLSFPDEQRYTLLDDCMSFPGLLVRVAGLAIVCSLMSIVFCLAMHETERLLARRVPNSFLRIALGGAAIVALTLLVGTGDYNGAGVEIIARAVEQGRAAPAAFFWKLVFTAVTIGCGFKGGEIVPTLFVGSTFGCAAGALLGLPAGFAAALGITGLFCGMTNCPLTSLLISVELFGADGLLCYAVVCAVSYVCSGYRGLYSSQTILYSKLRAEFINVHTK